jgi:histidine phosphotransferase ChpT
MSKSEAHLATLLGSRLCHDLISPVGAIQNGLELLSLSGFDTSGPEMTLIRESCESAAARIRFFRVAFGYAGEGQTMGRREVMSILSDVGKGGRIDTQWMPQDDLPRPEVQLAFLGHMCCESALPYGGKLHVDRDMAGWTLRASGRRLNIDTTLWDHLNGAAPLDTPAADRIQFALLPLLAESCRRKILASVSETDVTLKIA